MRIMGLCVALAMLLAGTGPLFAQGTSLADRLVECTGITAEGERLACYDAVAAPLAGLVAAEDEGVAFVGRGHWDSETFAVEHPFRVVWQSQASSLTIELRGAGGDLLALIGPQIGAGAGRSDEIYQPGNYQLGVRASDGDWRVQVVEE